MSNLIKLGLFTILGIAAILVSIIIVGNWSFSKGYDIYVLFNNAAGVPMKAKVRMAGVDIGRVENISLRQKQAVLKVRIGEDVTVYQNARIKIVSMGIIGTKYLDVDPGDPSYPAIEEDGEIMGVEEASLEDLIEKISGSFSSEQNGEMFENLAESIKDLKNIMDTISAQDEKIAEVVLNFDEFSKNLVSVTAKLDSIVDKINVGSGTIAALLNDEQMRMELQETVSSIKQSAISLQDTLGPVEQMRFEWNYTGRYNSLQSVYRNDVGVLITPRKGKFYYLGVANLANSSEPTDNNPSNTMNKLEALLGYRFDKFEIYGGVMRAEGGLGVGYSFFEPTWAPKRTLQVHVNVYSMGRKVDDGKKTAPIVDADLRVGFLKWLYGGVLIEDAAYKAGVTPYIKIQLDDQDIARMLGIVGIAASAAK